jgi:hypothetical protein
VTLSITFAPSSRRVCAHHLCPNLIDPSPQNPFHLSPHMPYPHHNTITPPTSANKMMLTSTFHQLPQQPYYSPYTPPRSSPLSTNATSPRLFDFGTVSQPKTPTPTRVYKANPVMQTRDAATKRRRDMFFRRVQTGREDKKWEARGEQVRVTCPFDT